MSFESIEHKLKLELDKLKVGSMYYVPDVLLDNAMQLCYRQGQIDGMGELIHSKPAIEEKLR